jgi:hypothetical protein
MVDISGYRSWCRSSGMLSWYLYVYPVQTIQENMSCRHDHIEKAYLLGVIIIAFKCFSFHFFIFI